MMKSGKKTHFWSQLLLSMIAIFALPAAQGLENQTTQNISGENHLSLTQQQILSAVREIRQTLVLPQYPLQSQQPSVKQEKIQPHFVTAEINPQAPIRAGPALL